MGTSSTVQNTLELARQGDPAAIAIILTYYLSQRFNTTASAIRLGDYLSVLIDAPFTTDQTTLVNLVLGILRDLKVEGITVIEMSARQMGDREVLWSQTIELADSHTSPLKMNELITSDLPALATAPDPAELARSSNSDASSSSQDWDGTWKTVFHRPEMVALLAFAIVLVLWDSYTEWMQEADLSQPLSGARLARRLGISSSTLKRFKYRANFSEWSQELDPDGIAWRYENKLFVPYLN